MQEIKDRLVTLMAEQLGEKYAERATEEGSEIFVDHGRGWADGDLDSLDKMEFVLAVEDEFKIDIPDYQIQGFRTLEDVAKFVHARKSAPLHGAH